MVRETRDLLSGMTALVTGGSKGYGKGIAAALHGAGAEVWITGRDEAALRATADEIGCGSIRADATVGEDWDRAIAQATAQSGRLDLLVNNAGGGIRVKPMTEQDDQAIRQSIEVNLVGPLLGCRRVAPLMKQQGGGLIINISSGCALHAWPGWGPYSAAKAGLNQFSHVLYVELREHGVRATTITPYWGATDFVDAAQIDGHPAGDPDIRPKVMQPEDMGQLVLDVCRTPARLVVPDITVQPLVQEIEPM